MSVYFELTVCLDNAAFWDPDGPNPGPETARILRTAADIVETDGCGGVLRLRDRNGNTVAGSRLYRDASPPKPQPDPEIRKRIDAFRFTLTRDGRATFDNLQPETQRAIVAGLYGVHIPERG